MVTKNRSAFYNESGSAFYNESGSASGSESSPRFITYPKRCGNKMLQEMLASEGEGPQEEVSMVAPSHADQLLQNYMLSVNRLA